MLAVFVCIKKEPPSGNPAEGVGGGENVRGGFSHEHLENPLRWIFQCS